MLKLKSQIAWQNLCGSHIIFFHVWLNEWSSIACLQFPLTYFLHIWPISEKLSNTDCFPHFLHIWPISGNSTTLTVFSLFFHSFSICGKYLEMVQKLINSIFSEYNKVRKSVNMDLTWPYNSHTISMNGPYFFPDNFQLWSIYGPYYWFGKGGSKKKSMD